MLKETAMQHTETSVLPKILVISGDGWDSDKATKFLEQIDSPVHFLPVAPIPLNIYALQAIKKHEDAAWIIVDITHFVKPDLLPLIEAINHEIRERIICLIPSPEEIRSKKKQKILDKTFPDLNPWKEPLRRLGVVHQVSAPTEYVLCISKKCLCKDTT